MPRGDRLVSIGRAGRWYFEWIDEWYGAPCSHVGVEFYSPEPDDLPDHVTWIANTAGDLSALADDSSDVVFSGQNIEHLWPEEVVGFLCESNRILAPGGSLVVDSPDRAATEAIGWTQPEHTVEFTAAEARELLELAGFEVTRCAGLWSCRDRSGSWLPFEASDVADIVERSGHVEGDPEGSFVWWLEAQLVGAPDRAALRRRVDEIYEVAWPERLNRWMTPLESDPDGLVRSADSPQGPLFGGPNTPLPPGTHHVRFRAAASDVGVAQCTVRAGERLVGSTEVPVSDEPVEIEVVVEIEEQVFGAQFRVERTGPGDIVCRPSAECDVRWPEPRALRDVPPLTT